MAFESDALVVGKVLSVNNSNTRRAEVEVLCYYKTMTPQDRKAERISVMEAPCPMSKLMSQSKYLMFLEKDGQGYKLRYTEIPSDFIWELTVLCGLELTSFVASDSEDCPPLEDSNNCLPYPTTPKPAPTPKPKSDTTPEPEPKTESPEVDVVIGGQEAGTPEPDGTNAATTSFLSCALSILSFVMSLLML